MSDHQVRENSEFQSTPEKERCEGGEETSRSKEEFCTGQKQRSNSERSPNGGEEFHGIRQGEQQLA